MWPYIFVNISAQRWVNMPKQRTNQNLNRQEKNNGLHSLYSRGDEGYADHYQVQNIEIVPAEGTFVEECSIGGHLLGSKVLY